MKRREFCYFIAQMRKEFPPLLPTLVRRKKLEDDRLGHCWLQYGDDDLPKRFYIEVSCYIRNWHLMQFVLMHEWAHVLSWTSEETALDDHGAEWGVAYSRLYRHFFDW